MSEKESGPESKYMYALIENGNIIPIDPAPAEPYDVSQDPDSPLFDQFHEINFDGPNLPHWTDELLTLDIELVREDCTALCGEQTNPQSGLAGDVDPTKFHD